MLIQSLEAYVEKDLDKAQKVIAHDDVIDDLFEEVKQELIELIRNHADEGEQAVDLLMKESGTMRQISQNGLSFPLQDRLRAKEKISINKYEKATIRKQIS